MVPVADMAKELPEQTEADATLTATVGIGLTATAITAVVLQPAPLEPVTV